MTVPLLGPCSDANREPMDLPRPKLLFYRQLVGLVGAAWCGGIPWKQLPGGARPAPEQDLDPYGIWIAEVMLQQTQLAVLSSLDALDGGVSSRPGRGVPDEVRLQWQGLGYYSRAAGCTWRSCWWTDPGRTLRAGWLAGHRSHHCRQHPSSAVNARCRSWMATSNGCWRA